jgi:hypothetical protein
MKPHLRVKPVVHGVRMLGWVSHMLSRAYRLTCSLDGSKSQAWEAVFCDVALLADLLADRPTIAALPGSEAARWVEVTYDAWPRKAVESGATPSNGLLAALREAVDEARKLAERVNLAASKQTDGVQEACNG